MPLHVVVTRLLQQRLARRHLQPSAIICHSCTHDESWAGAPPRTGAKGAARLSHGRPARPIHDHGLKDLQLSHAEMAAGSHRWRFKQTPAGHMHICSTTRTAGHKRSAHTPAADDEYTCVALPTCGFPQLA